MKRILSILFVLSIVIFAYAADNGKQIYRYEGNSISVVNVNDGGKRVTIRKGQILFLNAPDTSQTKILVSLDNSENVIPVEDKQLGDGKHWYEVFKRVDAKAAKAVPNVQVVAISDSVSVLRNLGTDTVVVFDKDKLFATLAPRSEANIYRTNGVDSVVLNVCGGPFLPITVTAKFGKAKSTFPWAVIIAIVVVLLLVVAAVVVLLVLRKRKNETDKSNIKEETFITSHEGEKWYPHVGSKKGKTLFVYQKVSFPDRTEDVDIYKNQLKKYYKDLNKKEVSSLLDKAEEEKNTLLPVFFKTEDPHNNDYKHKSLKHKDYWIKELPSYSPEESANNANAVETSTSIIKELLHQLSQLPEHSEEVTESVVARSDVDDITAKLTEAVNGIEETVVNAGSSVNDERVGQLRKELSEQKKASDKTIGKLNDTIAEQKDKFEMKIKQLDEKHASAIAAKDAAFEKERRQIKDDALQAVKEARKKADDEMKEYKTRLVFYKTCQPLAKQVVEFVDTIAQVKSLANKYYEEFMCDDNVPKDDTDTFCYFFARIENKYENSVGKIHDLTARVSEFRTLAATGLVQNGGWIDGMLNKELEPGQENLLRLNLYPNIMKDLGGAAIIMADEFAYQLPAMLPSATSPLVSEIAQLSNKLIKILTSIGYDVVYARPFTPIDQYSNDKVVNSNFRDIGVAKGTIIEVTKLAINHGSSKSKTEVSVQN